MALYDGHPTEASVYISSCIYPSGALKCFWYRRRIPYWVTPFSFMTSQLWSCVGTLGTERGSLAAAPQWITAMETARNSVYDIWRASKEVALTVFSPGHACICKVSSLLPKVPCAWNCSDSCFDERRPNQLQTNNSQNITVSIKIYIYT